MTSPAAELIAEKIRNADASGNLIAPIKDDLTEATIDEAYRVQRINTAWYLKQGRFISGRKIGLTSPAVQKQLGVDQPDFGVYGKTPNTRTARRFHTRNCINQKSNARSHWCWGNELMCRARALLT